MARSQKIQAAQMVLNVPPQGREVGSLQLLGWAMAMAFACLIASSVMA